MCYKAGDVINLTGTTSGAYVGFIQTDKQIYMHIPISKTITATSFTVNFSAVHARTDSGLISTTPNGNYPARMITAFGLFIAVDMQSSAYAGLQGKPAAVTPLGTITFA